MKKLVDYIGEPALLEQTAEECMELAFACLKLARMKRGENKVWGHTENELVNKIEEESADVEVCIGELMNAHIIDSSKAFEWRCTKKQRMRDRLSFEDKKKEDEKKSKGIVVPPFSMSDAWTCTLSCGDNTFTEGDLKKILAEEKKEEKKPEKQEEKKPEEKKPEAIAKNLVADIMAAFLIGLLAQDPKKKDDKDNKAYERSLANYLYFNECGESASEVARRMGKSESTIRSLLNDNRKA